MKLTSFLILPALLATALRAELPKESDYYTITSIPAPAGEVIEARLHAHEGTCHFQTPWPFAMP